MTPRAPFRAMGKRPESGPFTASGDLALTAFTAQLNTGLGRLTRHSVDGSIHHRSAAPAGSSPPNCILRRVATLTTITAEQRVVGDRADRAG